MSSAAIVLFSLSLLAEPKSPPKVASKPRLAVMDVKPLNGVTPDLAAAVSSALVLELRKSATEYSVISTDEIRTLLTVERQRSQLGCSEVGCLAEIGGALGASQMVSSTLGKFGSTYLLQVKLVDVRKAQVLREASERLSSADDNRLLAAVAHVARGLFAPPSEEPPAPFDEPAVEEQVAPPHAHTWGLVLGGVAVAGLAAGILGALEVSSYQSDASAATTGIVSNNVGQASTYKSGAALTGEYQQAKNVWQPLAFTGFIVAALAMGGAVLTW